MKKYIFFLLVILGCSNTPQNLIPIDGMYVSNNKIYSILIMDKLLTINGHSRYTILYKYNEFFLVQGPSGNILKWCYIYRKEEPLNIGYLLVVSNVKCNKFYGWRWVSYKE